MPSVFASNPIGNVVVLPTNQTATFSLIDTDIPTTKSTVMGWSMGETVNAQFTHTMGDDIYMNVFGNRVGQLTIQGISFNTLNCDPSQHGIVEIINYYRANRISSNSQPITITIGGRGGITIKGALTAATYNSNAPENWMVQYSITIATVPT